MQLIHIGLLVAVLYFPITYLDGISLVSGPHGFLISFLLLALIFSFIEIVLHPLLRLIFLPVRMLSFGIVSIVLSICLVWLVVFLYPPFDATTFWIFVIGFIFALLQRLR